MSNDPAYKSIDAPRAEKRYSDQIGPKQNLNHGIYTKIAGIICGIGMAVSVMLILFGGLMLFQPSGGNTYRSAQQTGSAIIVLFSGVGLLITTSLTGVLVEISRKLTK